ncbi:hypothetical protein HAX54_005087 [Datura stramonium]|uniref:Uncharacterized protein n=1 Tax=Datura stramonium TaxID=4076 RepID=A0ABS8T9P7_DATST|nr:hypothetical protein [Datura stramonium]
MEQRFEENDTHHSKIAMYLATSKYILKHRNFEDCYNYALKAIEVFPNETAPSQIHAIAKVLLISSSANVEPNHYSILKFPLHTQDQQLIRTNFTNATNLLNPNQNPYPFANEAFKHELKEKTLKLEKNHDSEFHNERNDGYYVADEDDINMVSRQTIDLGFEDIGGYMFF